MPTSEEDTRMIKERERRARGVSLSSNSDHHQRPNVASSLTDHANNLNRGDDSMRPQVREPIVAAGVPQDGGATRSKNPWASKPTTSTTSTSTSTSTTDQTNPWSSSSSSSSSNAAATNTAASILRSTDPWNNNNNAKPVSSLRDSTAIVEEHEHIKAKAKRVLRGSVQPVSNNSDLVEEVLDVVPPRCAVNSDRINSNSGHHRCSDSFNEDPDWQIKQRNRAPRASRTPQAHHNVVQPPQPQVGAVSVHEGAVAVLQPATLRIPGQIPDSHGVSANLRNAPMVFNAYNPPQPAPTVQNVPMISNDYNPPQPAPRVQNAPMVSNDYNPRFRWNGAAGSTHPPEESSSNKNEKDADIGGDVPFYKTKMFTIVCLAAIVAVAVVAGIGIGMASSGSKVPKTSPPTSPRTTSPTTSPTESPLDPIKSAVVRSHIINNGISSAEDLNVSSSPQNKAYKWIVRYDDLSRVSEDMTDQEKETMVIRYSLAVYYYALGGQNWDDTQNWLYSFEPHCEWVHVWCDEDEEIVQIRTKEGGQIGNNPQLGANNLEGTLPSEIKTLPWLKRIQLPGNQIKNIDALAAEGFNSLTELDLATNPLEGMGGIYGLPRLETLSLWKCDIPGTLSTDFKQLTNLKTIDLRENKLSGQITNEFGSLPRVDLLLINDNKFTGDIFEVMSGMEDTIKNFVASNNDFSGTLGPWIGDFQKLELLNLDTNEITGTLPSELGLVTTIKTLYLRNNDIEGTIPEELERLTDLRSLHLEKTLVSGTIPEGLCALENLKIVTSPFLQCDACPEKCSG